MADQLRESPFRDVGEGRPWQYMEQPEEPEFKDRSWVVTALGIGMLAQAGVVALPTVKLAPVLFYLTAFGAASDVFRDVFVTAFAMLLVTLTPMTLALVMAFGLFRMAPWSHRASIIALPVMLALGGVVWGYHTWTQLYRIIRDAVQWTDPRVLNAVGWYALATVPLTAVMLYLLTRPEVGTELRNADEEA